MLWFLWLIVVLSSSCRGMGSREATRNWRSGSGTTTEKWSQIEDSLHLFMPYWCLLLGSQGNSRFICHSDSNMMILTESVVSFEWSSVSMLPLYQGSACVWISFLKFATFALFGNYKDYFLICFAGTNPSVSSHFRSWSWRVGVCN